MGITTHLLRNNVLPNPTKYTRRKARKWKSRICREESERTLKVKNEWENGFTKHKRQNGSLSSESVSSIDHVFVTVSENNNRSVFEI